MANAIPGTSPTEAQQSPEPRAGESRSTAGRGGSLLAQLRQRTASSHERLDVGLGMDASLTPARYDAFLRASLAVVEGLEAAVAGHVGRFDPSCPSRATCLRHDRRVLAEAESLAPDELAPSWNVPARLGEAEAVLLRRPASLAEAYGAAYVLEGSSLGGMVLARVVEEVLGFDGPPPTTYLRLRGARTGEAWRWFLSCLDAFDAIATPAERGAACDFALRTFDAYHAAFAREGVLRS